MNHSYSKRTYRRRIISEINVVPYIDVTLVLLIIFMITAPLQQNAVQVSLPAAEGAKIEIKDQPVVIISIAKDGQFYLTDKENTNQPVTLSGLLFQLAAFQKSNPQNQVYLKADKEVDYGKVVAVMAALKKAGVVQVGLLTSPAEP
jgi:biopolymer transport protein TolR